MHALTIRGAESQGAQQNQHPAFGYAILTNQNLRTLQLRLRLDAPTTFGTAPDGSVLIASQRGTLYRLVAR